MSLHVGTSGYSYKPWKGKFYPKDLPDERMLAYYAERFPTYGQNLVAIAEIVRRAEESTFVMVDVGANVGDSALQVLAKVDARVLCVEGDRYWLDYLHRNVDSEPRVTLHSPGRPSHISANETASGALGTRDGRAGGSSRMRAISVSKLTGR